MHILSESSDWFRTRKYLHFDLPISLEKARKIVTNPNKVALHAFLPLIHYDLETYKVVQKQNCIEKTPKKRPISFASHIDSHIYSYYSKLLCEFYESKISESNLGSSVLAFRALRRSNIEHANEVFENVKQRENCFVVALDVTKFFENLTHLELKKAWQTVLGISKLPDDHFNVFKSLTKYSKVNRDKLYKQLNISKYNPKYNPQSTQKRRRVCEITDFRLIVRKNKLIETNYSQKGIPQGTPISALLSNIYMLDFDREMLRYVQSIGGSYYRYCDDMLFILPKDDMGGELISLVGKRLKKIGLELNDKKTEMRKFCKTDDRQTCDKPLQYLGFTYDGERKLIRSAALSRFSRKMKKGVKLAHLTRDKRNLIKKKKGIPTSELYRRKIYERYSHLGRRNFVTYGYRAAKIMESKAIRKQLKPLWERLQREIETKEKKTNDKQALTTPKFHGR